MITEVDDFLEHFGVRGMRWGQRKQSAGAKPKRTPQEQAQRRQKQIVAASTVASLVSIGASFMLMRQSSARTSARRTPTSYTTPVNILPRTTVNRGSAFVRSAIPMGPIGSTGTGVVRLRGAIPLP